MFSVCARAHRPCSRRLLKYGGTFCNAPKCNCVLMQRQKKTKFIYESCLKINGCNDQKAARCYSLDSLQVSDGLCVGAVRHSADGCCSSRCFMSNATTWTFRLLPRRRLCCLRVVDAGKTNSSGNPIRREISHAVKYRNRNTISGHGSPPPSLLCTGGVCFGLPPPFGFSAPPSS
jgi:hypothetical protein